VYKEIKIGNKKIFYNHTGSGRIVVLIHGFGEDGSVWDHQVKFLKNNFRLIIPDLPGSGKSEMVDDMSMEGMADVIKQILDTELSKDSPSKAQVLLHDMIEQNDEGIGIIGHSMGGYITLAFAERYPGYLNGFGLFHSSAYPDNDEKKEIRRKGIEFINQHGAFEFLKTSIPNLFSLLTREQKPQLVKDHVDSASNFSEAALLSYYKSMMQRPNRITILEKASIPVLFIMGEYDTAVPLSDSLKLCSLPEKVYIHLLQYSGHMGMYEEVGKTNQILGEYLNDILRFTPP